MKRVWQWRPVFQAWMVDEVGGHQDQIIAISGKRVYNAENPADVLGRFFKA
jgi:hypothetical protein